MKACIVLIVLAVAVQAQKFEPAKCDYSKEIYCSGTWNEDWTEQITADYCMPYKNGDCSAYCPKQCGKEEILCPRMDPKGCPIPDTCYPAKAHCLRSEKKFHFDFEFFTFYLIKCVIWQPPARHPGDWPE